MSENLGGLFDMDPVVWNVGDKVIARTMWGDETGVIESIERLSDDHRFAVVVSDGPKGTFGISLTRMRRA